jgi:hypothetical protein
MTEDKWIEPPRTPEKIKEWNAECDQAIESTLSVEAIIEEVSDEEDDS